MNTLTLQRQITKLQRQRAELSALLYVHALADEDPAALVVYHRLLALDAEIYALKQLKDDQFLSRYLEQNGAPAVAWVKEFLGCE